MKLNGLYRAQHFSALWGCKRPIWLHGLSTTFDAANRVNLHALECYTSISGNRSYSRTVALRRSSSNSAIKHLISGTSTTLWLYNDLSQVHELPEVTDAALLNLVKDGKFGAADRLRLQLTEHGTEIEPHPAYEQAAIANLQWADMEQCLTHFTTWFSLVPEYDPSNPPTYPGAFKNTRHVLIHTGSPSARLPLILRFGIISASKGYLQPMFHEILPIVVRFASAEGGATWLYNMELAAVQYQKTHHPREAQETARRYRTFTIEICCQAGWLAHAASIVQLERSFTLPTRTYTVLIQALQNAGRLGDVKLVDKYLNHDISQSRQFHLGEFTPTPFRAAAFDPLKPTTAVIGDNGAQSSPAPSFSSPRSRPHYKVLTARPPFVEDPKDVHKRTVSRQTVATQLRFFKRCLRNRSCPDLLQIIRFLSDFQTIGGSQRIVTLLRRRALSRGKYSSMAWMKAELCYHNVERNYEEILKLYLMYLDPEVPLPGIFSYTLTRIAEKNRFKIVPAPLPKYALRDRWLVLKSIIRLAPDLPWPLATMQALYASYHGATKDMKTCHRESNEILATFIAAFGECGSLHDAARVLSDSGATPYLRQVETLASVLAGAGKAEQAMALLKRIEAGAKDRRMGMQVKGYDGKVDVALPRPATYGRMIEGFCAAGLLEPALEVEKMMKMRFSYEYGPNKKLDDAMKGLWALEMEHALGQPTSPSIYS